MVNTGGGISRFGGGGGAKQSKGPRKGGPGGGRGTPEPPKAGLGTVKKFPGIFGKKNKKTTGPEVNGHSKKKKKKNFCGAGVKAGGKPGGGGGPAPAGGNRKKNKNPGPGICGEKKFVGFGEQKFLAFPGPTPQFFFIQKKKNNINSRPTGRGAGAIFPGGYLFNYSQDTGDQRTPSRGAHTKGGGGGPHISFFGVARGWNHLVHLW